MFKKSKKGYYFWEEFAEVEGIVHGFSTRKSGDMNNKNPRSNFNISLFCKSLGINKDRIIKMQQIHSNNVILVSNDKRLHLRQGVTFSKTDGLVSQKKGLFLVATFADCVPIVLLDKKKKTVGIAHAGWRGAYKEVVKNMIIKMTKVGSRVDNIIIGIGPSIRAYCYDIDEGRANSFLQKFAKWSDKIIKNRSNKIFLDLQSLIKLQLLELGVLEKNVYDCEICTSDNLSDFFSFRKEGKKSSFGLCAGVIGKT